MITIRSAQELVKLEEASRIVLETLDVVEKAVAPGVTTEELDRIAESEIKKRGARPAFVGYRGYPKTLCTSINDEVVHGIPGRRALQEGDSSASTAGRWPRATTATPPARSRSAGSTPRRRSSSRSPRRPCTPGSPRRSRAAGSRTSARRSKPSPSSTATAWSATSWATASARRSTRSRRSRTTARAGGGAC